MNEDKLRKLIAEATVDCYGEYEEFWGMLAQLEDELDCPFTATVLGDTVQVAGIDGEAGAEQRAGDGNGGEKRPFSVTNRCNRPCLKEKRPFLHPLNSAIMPTPFTGS